MVSKKWIVKSLDSAIQKCRKGGGLSNLVKGALNRFAEISKNFVNEQTWLITPNGEVVEVIDGDRNHCSLPLDTAKRYGGDLSIEHNHPHWFNEGFKGEKLLPTCLSESDMMRLVDREYVDDDLFTPYKSITCESYGGCRVTLNRLGVGDDNVVLKKANGDMSDWMEFHGEYVTAVANLKMNYGKFMASFNDTGGLLDRHMSNWRRDWNLNNPHNQEVIKQKPVDWDALEHPSDEEYYNEMSNFVKTYCRENYGDSLKESMDEFKKLGFELTVEWK